MQGPGLSGALAAVRERFREAMIDTDRELATRIVRDALAQRARAEDLVFEVVLPSMERIMGSSGADRGTSLAQHFMASQIASDIVEELLPLFEKVPAPVGRVVIGTASGDFHGLGKRIVGGCLRATMIEVVDLGLNVPAARFVEEALAREAEVIAVSAMMVHTAIGDSGSLGVRRILRERGLEKRFRLIVGGAPYRYDSSLYLRAGADAWGENGLVASQVVTDLIREARAR